MVIDDLDLPGIAVAPYQADTPLLVDANTVPSPSISPQGFQPVAGRRPQIVEPPSRVDRQELGPRPPLDLHRQASDGMAREDGRGALVGEALDHGRT